MSENQLALEAREDSGKGVARKLRAAGRAPAVCYARGESAVAVSLDPHELEVKLRKSAAGLNTLFDVKGGGLDGKVVLVKELQRDPVRRDIIHADLFAIDANATVEVEVPVRMVGTPIGVTMGGGILDHPLREIQLSCLPRAIPEDLPIDVAALELGESVHVRDVALPTGVELLSDPDLTVVSVVAPTKVEEETPVVEEEVAEGDEAPKAEGDEKPTDEEKPEKD